MAAQRFDFTRGGCGNSVCEQGATFSYELVWEKEDPPDSGEYVVVDLTGYTAKMQVRKGPGSPLIVELSTSNSRITINGSLGKISLLIAATATESLEPGLYKYDLELTDSSGFVTRFIEGAFEIVGQITV